MLITMSIIYYYIQTTVKNCCTFNRHIVGLKLKRRMSNMFVLIKSKKNIFLIVLRSQSFNSFWWTKARVHIMWCSINFCSLIDLSCLWGPLNLTYAFLTSFLDIRPFYLMDRAPFLVFLTCPYTIPYEYVGTYVLCRYVYIRPFNSSIALCKNIFLDVFEQTSLVNNKWYFGTI